MQTPLEMLNLRHYFWSRPCVYALSSCRFCIQIYPFRCRYSNFATIPFQKPQLNDHLYSSLRLLNTYISALKTKESRLNGIGGYTQRRPPQVCDDIITEIAKQHDHRLQFE